MHLRLGVLLSSFALFVFVALVSIPSSGQVPETDPALENSIEEISGAEGQNVPPPEIMDETNSATSAQKKSVITELPPEEQVIASPAPQATQPPVETQPGDSTLDAEMQSVEAPPTETPTTGEAKAAPPEEEQEKKPIATGEVEFETPKEFSKQKDCKCTVSYLLPYRERRENWGWTFGIGMLQFAPLNYSPDFVVNQTFDSYYGTAETPMIQATVGLQKNFSFASVAMELSGGKYSNVSSDNATLSVIPVEASLKLQLDTIFREPYLVPYGSAGIYTMLYNESQASKSVQGNTRISFFYSAGMLFQMDWMDPDTELEAYVDYGIQNTFLYAEVKGYFASAKPDPDFATNPQLGFGMKLEF